MNIFVLPISLVVIMFSVFLWRRAAGSLSIYSLNMISWPFYLLYTITWLSIFIAAKIEVGHLTYHKYLFIFRNDTAISVWVAVMWMYLAMPAAAGFVNYFQSGKFSLSRTYENYRAKSILLSTRVTQDKQHFLPYLLVTVVYLLFQIYSLIRMGENIPLLNIIQTGDIIGTQYLRSSEFTESSWFFMVFSVIWGNIKWWSYILFLISTIKKNPAWRILFGIVFVYCIIASIINTTITNLVIYLLSFVMITALIEKKALWISIKKLMLFALPIILLPSLFKLFKGAEGSYINVMVENVFSRVFFSQLGGTYFSYEVFPKLHDFLYLSSTGKLLHNLIGMPSNPSYGIIQMWFYNPLGVQAGTAGHFTSNYLSEAWANFGWVGWMVAPIWVGAFIQLINRWFLCRDKTIFYVATYVHLSTTFGYARDFVSFYYPLGTVLSLIGIYVIARIMKLI